MKVRLRASPRPVGALTPEGMFAPVVHGTGVRFAVVVGNAVVPGFASSDALEALDGGRHPNLRPLGIYELNEGRILAIAAELASTLKPHEELVITREHILAATAEHD